MKGNIQLTQVVSSSLVIKPKDQPKLSRKVRPSSEILQSDFGKWGGSSTKLLVPSSSRESGRMREVARAG